MKIFNSLFSYTVQKHKKNKKVSFVDAYQESLNKLGREQLKSLLEKGIELQPISLAH